MIKIKGEVIKVEKKDISISTIVQGIKQGSPIPFGATAGSRGTFRIGYPSISQHLFITVSIFNSNSCENQKVNIDVRESARNTNGWTNITESRVTQLRDKLINKYVDIENRKGEWALVDETMIVNIGMPNRTPVYSEVFAPPQQFDTVIDYLKFRFISLKQYRDFLLSNCKKEDYRAQHAIFQSFPYKDEFLNKPIGTQVTDSDYSDDVKIVHTGGKRIIVLHK